MRRLPTAAAASNVLGVDVARLPVASITSTWQTHAVSPPPPPNTPGSGADALSTWIIVGGAIGAATLVCAMLLLARRLQLQRRHLLELQMRAEAPTRERFAPLDQLAANASSGRTAGHQIDGDDAGDEDDVLEDILLRKSSTSTTESGVGRRAKGVGRAAVPHRRAPVLVHWEPRARADGSLPRRAGAKETRYERRAPVLQQTHCKRKPGPLPGRWSMRSLTRKLSSGRIAPASEAEIDATQARNELVQPANPGPREGS